MKKKVVMIVAVLMVVFMMAACTPAADKASESPSAEATQSEEAAASASEDAQKPDTGDKKLRIGMGLYSLKNEFTVRLANAAQAKCDELGIELEVYDGDYDASTMISQVETMIANGVDGILFDPVDADACATAVDIAIKNNIPMVGVNARVNHEGLTSYVGSLDVTAGEMEMQFMADHLGGKGKIVIIEGPLGQSAQLERRQGIDNILAKYPDIEVLADQTGNWSRSEGMTLMENWLNTFEQIDGIVGENDEMALGARNAADALGKEIPAVGVDGITDALNAIKEGNMIGTCFQDGWTQAQKGVEVLVDAMNGKQVDKEYWIDFELVTPENVESFMQRNQ